MNRKDLILVVTLPNYERVIKLVLSSDKEDVGIAMQFNEDLPEDIANPLAVQTKEDKLYLLVGVKPGKWTDFRRFLTEFSSTHGHRGFLHEDMRYHQV